VKEPHSDLHKNLINNFKELTQWMLVMSHLVNCYLAGTGVINLKLILLNKNLCFKTSSGLNKSAAPIFF